MVCIRSSPNKTPRCPNFWSCGNWCDLNFTNMPPSSSSKSSIASGVMSLQNLLTLSLWVVIVSQVVVLIGATILNLALDIKDGGHWEVDIYPTVFVDQTHRSCLLNLGNHRCQCKGHD